LGELDTAESKGLPSMKCGGDFVVFWHKATRKVSDNLWLVDEARTDCVLIDGESNEFLNGF
jgi:hypothetical protein